MKIFICGSMRLSRKMLEVKKELVKLGHTITLPRNTEKYALLNTSDHMHNESVKNKINHDLIRQNFRDVNNNDAILVVNDSLKDIANYVGGNSFLEMGFAYVLNKKIYLLNPIPKMFYSDELVAMQPIVLNNDFSKIQTFLILDIGCFCAYNQAMETIVLSKPEIKKKLKNLSGWKYRNNKIFKEFKFKDFSDSLALVKKLEKFCNKIDHHPDIHIFYNKVLFELQRFDIGGKVTNKDFVVAKKIEQIYGKHKTTT